MERICSSRSTFFSLRAGLFWKIFVTQGRKQAVTKVVSLCINDGGKNIEVNPNTLIALFESCEQVDSYYMSVLQTIVTE